MSALAAKLGQWFSTYVLKYLIRYFVDHVTAYVERRAAESAQKKKDEETKKKYDEAINQGGDDDIVKETENRLNS